MPRATKSPEGAILDFFRSAPLIAAEIVFNLVRDVIKGRQANDHERKAAAEHRARVAQGRKGALIAAKRRKQAHAAHAAVTPAPPAVIRKAPKRKPKKSAGNGAEAEVESFSVPSRG